MITLKQYLESIEYKITGGDEFLWNSFGPNVRSIDCEALEDFSISALFDTQTQTVYSVEAHDYLNERSYRFINPAYTSFFAAECIERNVDYDVAYDGLCFIDLEVEEDMLEKVSAMVGGREYDERVVIPLDLDKDVIYYLAMMAHERDITLNDLMVEIIQQEIDKLSGN